MGWLAPGKNGLEDTLQEEEDVFPAWQTYGLQRKSFLPSKTSSLPVLPGVRPSLAVLGDPAGLSLSVMAQDPGAVPSVWDRSWCLSYLIFLLLSLCLLLLSLCFLLLYLLFFSLKITIKYVKCHRFDACEAPGTVSVSNT